MRSCFAPGIDLGVSGIDPRRAKKNSSRERIPRIVPPLEKSHELPNSGIVPEKPAAPHRNRNPGGGQGFQPFLVASNLAKQERHFVKGNAALHFSLDPRSQILRSSYIEPENRFQALVLRPFWYQRIVPHGGSGKSRFTNSIGILDDPGSTPKVPAKDPVYRQLLAELGENADVRISKTIDRLLGITDDTEVRSVGPGETPNDPRLKGIRVLKLVHHHEIKALVKLASHTFVL